PTAVFRKPLFPDLSRIHDAARIECALHLLHEVERGAVLERRVATVPETEAVLAGDGPAELEHAFEDRVFHRERRLPACAVRGIFRDQHVDDAEARMTERVERGPGLVADPVARLDHLGKA